MPTPPATTPFAPNYTSPGDIRLSYYSMVSDSKKKRLEAKAAKAAAEGKPIARVKSAASLKKNASVADSLASQMEEGTCLLLFDAFFPRSVFRFVPRVVCAGGGGRRTGSEAGTRLARVMLGNLAAADCRGGASAMGWTSQATMELVGTPSLRFSGAQCRPEPKKCGVVRHTESD